MNTNKITHYSIIIFFYLAVLYPLWVRITSLQWGFNASFLPNLFPLFGLAAFSMLWLHSISGPLEPFLRKHIDLDKFVHITANLILICIILHPLLLLATFNFNIKDIYLAYGVIFIRLGIIGWTLLITYDIGKALKKYDFFVKHWNTILIVSNIGFLLTFFHSLYLGSDLQSGPLRIIWMFYGITAFLSILYTYGKPILVRLSGRYK